MITMLHLHTLSFICVVMVTSVGLACAQASEPSKTIEKIIAEMPLRTIEGQDRLMNEYGEHLVENDPTGMTARYEYDSDRSILTSYAYISEEAAKNYKPEALIERTITQLSETCSEPIVKTLRMHGITQRAILLDNSGEIFGGFESIAKRAWMVDEDLTEIEEVWELTRRINALEAGEPYYPVIRPGCVRKLGWREKWLPYNETNGDRSGDLCSAAVRVDLYRTSGVDVIDYRLTPYVQGVEARYEVEKSRRCG